MPCRRSGVEEPSYGSPLHADPEESSKNDRACCGCATNNQIAKHLRLLQLEPAEAIQIMGYVRNGIGGGTKERLECGEEVCDACAVKVKAVIPFFLG